MHKNKPQIHSPQQNRKTVLTAAGYFKVFTPVWSLRERDRDRDRDRERERVTALCLCSFTQKGVSGIK